MTVDESQPRHGLPSCCQQRLDELRQVCRRVRSAGLDDTGVLAIVVPHAEALARCGQRARANPGRLLGAFDEILVRDTDVSSAGRREARGRFADAYYGQREPR